MNLPESKFFHILFATSFISFFIACEKAENSELPTENQTPNQIIGSKQTNSNENENGLDPSTELPSSDLGNIATPKSGGSFELGNAMAILPPEAIEIPAYLKLLAADFETLQAATQELIPESQLKLISLSMQRPGNQLVKGTELKKPVKISLNVGAREKYQIGFIPNGYENRIEVASKKVSIKKIDDNTSEVSFPISFPNALIIISDASGVSITSNGGDSAEDGQGEQGVQNSPETDTPGEAAEIPASLTKITLLSEPLIADKNRNNAIEFMMEFSEEVKGLDATDLILTTTDTLKLPTITNIQSFGKLYAIRIKLSEGFGDVALSLSTDHDLLTNSNSLPVVIDAAFIGESYTVVSPPKLLTVKRLDENPTTLANVRYELKFSGDVLHVDANDFQFETTGTLTNLSIVNVTGDKSTYEVTVSTGQGSGQFTMKLSAAAAILDGEFQDLNTTEEPTYETYSITSNSPPQMISLVKTGASPTLSDTLDFRVTFSKPINGFDTTDLELLGNADVELGAVSCSGNICDIAVNRLSMKSGTVRLRLKDDDTIVDSDSRPLDGIGTSQNFYTMTDYYDVKLFAEPDFVQRKLDDPNDVDVGDFNTDGREDIVVADSNHLLVFWRDSSGFYSTQSHIFESGSGINDIAVGDIDGDSDLDIAVSEYNTDSFFILINDGAGSFNKVVVKSYSSSNNSPRHIALADIDKDGKLDIITVSNRWVAWLENLGNNTFTIHSLTTTGRTEMREAEAEDMDGDGDIDIVITDRDDGLMVYENNAMNFTEVPALTGVGSFRGIEIGDFDGDSELDIAYIRDHNVLGVLLNNSDGTYTNTIVSGTVNEYGEITVGDFDDDNDLDIGFSDDGNGGRFVVFVNNGSASFTQNVLQSNNYGYRGEMVFHDLDGDNDLELIAIDEWWDRVYIYHNNASVFQEEVIFNSFDQARAFDVGDIDNNGLLDIFIASSYNDLMESAVFFQQSDGSFIRDTFKKDSRINQAKVANIDGTSGDEIIYYRYHPADGLEWASFNSLGDYSNNVITAVSASHEIRDIQVVDLNKDTHLDIVTSRYPSRNHVTVFENNGIGNFTQAYHSPSLGDSPQFFDVFDFNSDTHLDIFVPSSQDWDAVKLFAKDADFGFTLSDVSITATCGEPHDVVVADFNGDTRPDFIVHCEQSDTLLYYEDNSSGGYSETQLDTFDDVYQMEKSDFDQDGDMDFFVINNTTHQVSFYENNGDGTFNKNFVPVKFGNDISFVIRDFDGDGDEDLILNGNNSTEIAILKSNLIP